MVLSGYPCLKDTGLVEGTSSQYTFRDEFVSRITHLRLLVHFPASIYVSKVTGDLSFLEYVPADMDHLPKVSRSIREGFCLFVPTDPTAIQKIQGEFIKLD